MTEPSPSLPGTPWLPPGHTIELAGRGETFVRDTGGPEGAPALLLLHGWAVTADLNWFPAYPVLAEQYRVVALDNRGHGRGIRPANGIVRLPDCADDAAALLDALDIEQAIVVGYSMGGAIGQLVWHRHRERVSGLVLASTARHFQGGGIVGDLWYRSQLPLAHLAHRVPGPADVFVRKRIDRRMRGEERAEWMRQELERVSPAGLLSSMGSVGSFSSTEWIGDVDVPAAVIVASEDQTIPARAQRRLAACLPDAIVREFAGPHDSIVTRADDYVPVLAEVIAEVVAAQQPSG